MKFRGIFIYTQIGIKFMYLDFFGFKEEPFSLTPNPKFIFWSKHHEKAVESLCYGIEHRKGFLTLTGEIGTGKTTLCREIVGRLGVGAEVSVILNPLVSVSGLLKAINKDFGNSIRRKSAEDQLEHLSQFLLKKAQDGRNAVVMIDEAQNLSVESLEMVRLLSNLETDSKKLLQIVLIGQPELEQMLATHALRQINQRISIRERLFALEYEPWCAYVANRLVLAGSKGRVQFDKRALKNVFHQVRGYPRLTNILCDRILLAAFANRTFEINKKIVDESIEDLNW